ncbi:SbcC/MukB-like Walker B domain-containing protein [Terasakiella pusilla]|uniref:SbcC/MukB-like Walker B domain-containing protein n=1 Tax=Terasakiella pusilla TaxID=64973 RepID=UPI003AA8FA3E
MKILNVRFKNLNSLVGEWSIDFTDPAFTTEGIFAITGPTGAGKSTILDAICLALFGQTPRLGKISQGSNEIMSRQTGICFSEVTFESQSGTYRSHWSQHRSREKADGNLQSPKHELSDAASGNILSNKVSQVPSLIEDVTGMDFSRFTRSILLAQGEFAKFLTSSADQRAPILEQITGTEIYSQISIFVHERNREENDKLQQLKQAVDHVTLLSEEDLTTITEDLERATEQLDARKTANAQLSKTLHWRQSIDKLTAELKSLEDAQVQLANDTTAFATQRKALLEAQKAASLDSLFATLQTKRADQTADQAQRTREEEKLPQLIKTGEDSKVRFDQAVEAFNTARQQQANAQNLLKAVRQLDHQIQTVKDNLASAQSQIDKEETALKNLQAQHLQNHTDTTRLRQQRAESDEYLRTHAADESLIADLAGIEAQLNALRDQQKALTLAGQKRDHAHKAVEEAAEKVAQGSAALTALHTAFESATTKKAAAQDQLDTLLAGRLLREYQTEKDTLVRELGFKQQIATLEAQRQHLEDGKACPLCGATDHPFAQGNVPAPDETELQITEVTRLIEQIEHAQQNLQDADKAVTQAREKHLAQEHHNDRLRLEQTTAQTTLSDAENQMAEAKASLAKSLETVQARLHPLGIDQIDSTNTQDLLAQLRHRRDLWHNAATQKTTFEKEADRLETQKRHLEQNIQDQTKRLAQQHADLETLRHRLTTQQAERQNLFDDKDPDQEEKRLNDHVAQTEQHREKCETHYRTCQQTYTTAKEKIDVLKARLTERADQLHGLEHEFITQLNALGFEDEASFNAARLPAVERDHLQQQATELENRRLNLTARQAEKTEALHELRTQHQNDLPLEDLQNALAEGEARLGELQSQVASLRHRLDENERAKELIKDRQSAITAQQRECVKWNSLHQLIGSSDGKKFRNFAQGLTFEVMIKHANQQLSKMSDRYLLLRDTTQPLDLNVMDNYQGGDVRSTKNLSGGESFIVSLALALGLAQMASHNVRVDSLFLDEGFGTLDEDALETALETLSSLQQDGKLIGVISHVQALKDRIPTQIHVTPTHNGRSRLNVPGVTSGR